MVSSLIGDLKGDAEKYGVGQTKDAIAKTDAILDGGAKRTPAELAVAESDFTNGDSLSTADGQGPSASTSPADKTGSADPKLKDASLSVSKPIEFIHFGIVHQDTVRNFAFDKSMSDTDVIDMTTITGSRAIMFRAALEREAVLLGGLVTGTQMAFKAQPPDMSKLKPQDGSASPLDAAQGAVGKLLDVGADLAGGKSSSTAETAGSADLAPFLDKLKTLWTPLTQAAIQYDNLHDAGIQLHEVRVSLRKYLRDQVQAKKDGPPDAQKGLLSTLPVIGQVTIPGEIGTAIGFMQKVTSKIQDVKTLMIMNLIVAMEPAMNAACHQASIDQIQKKTSPIYPIWFIAPAADPTPDHSQDQIAKREQTDVLTGQLAQIPGANAINQGAQTVNKGYNDGINKAAEEPMKVIDFLEMKVDPAPGSAYLATVFQVKSDPDDPTSPLAGSKALGDLAYQAFGMAMGDGSIPGFLDGFVKTFVTEVFVVSVEFLRAVYGKLVSLKMTDTVDPAALATAGRSRLINALVDFGVSKSGIDKLLKDHKLPNLPKPPFTPPGVTWPKTDNLLSIDPIIAEFKKLLTDKLAPYLNPVIDYVMAGLATRLNAQRAWATPMGMTMEAHIAQLPGEIVQMFIGLFGPLWGFINDTLMGLINNALNKVLGPLGKDVGLARDGLGHVSSMIDKGEKMADGAMHYAQNIEGKVKTFLGLLNNVNANSGKGGLDNVGALAAAGSDVVGAVGQNPLASGDGTDPNAKAAGADASANASFVPSDRVANGTGSAIDKTMLDKVEPDNKWKNPDDATTASTGDGSGATNGGVK